MNNEQEKYIKELKDKIYQLEQNLVQCENGYKLELTAERTENVMLKNENEFLKNKCDTIERNSRKKTAEEIICELEGEVGIAKFTFNSKLADELKTICLRLKKYYGVE